MSRLVLSRLLLLLAVFLPLLGRPASAAVGPTFTYTGQLLAGTTSVPNGSYDFQFTLYSAATGGSTVGSTLSVTSVPVASGIFYVELNFTGVSFSSGTTLYLQTAYRKSGTTAYTTQSPRKLIPTTSYADYAAASGSTASLQGFFVSARPPTDGQVLTWTSSGNKWLPQTPTSRASYTAGTGLTLSGTQFSVAPSGITNSLVATNAISNSKIADNAVSNSKLANDSVSNSKIATNAVSNSKLADGSVTTGKLADGSVTTAKLAGGTLTVQDQDSSVRQPVECNIGVSTTSSSSFFNLVYTVPAGKELVVESMTLFDNAIESNRSFMGLVLNQDSAGNIVSFAALNTGLASSTLASTTQPMRLHVAAGGKVLVNVFADGTSGINVIVSLSGFLVSAP